MSEDKRGSLQMTKAKVFALYVATILSMLSFAYGIVLQVAPQLLETDRQHEMVHEEAERIALSFPTEMNKKYHRDSLFFAIEINKANTMAANALNLARLLEKENEALLELVNAGQKQTDFNTQSLSITNDVVLELMHPSQSNHSYKHYYTKDKRDRWNLFEDYYESRVFYGVELRTGNRAFYTPTFRSKIKIQ